MIHSFYTWDERKSGATEEMQFVVAVNKMKRYQLGYGTEK